MRKIAGTSVDLLAGSLFDLGVVSYNLQAAENLLTMFAVVVGVNYVGLGRTEEEFRACGLKRSNERWTPRPESHD